MSSSCVGFRVTSNFTDDDPTGTEQAGLPYGTREPSSDVLACDAVIPVDFSGFCDCGGGVAVSTDRIAGLKHGGVELQGTCDDACASIVDKGLRLSDNNAAE